MRHFRACVVRMRTRAAYPALAVAMGLATLGAGLDRTAFLTGRPSVGGALGDSTSPLLGSITRGLHAASAGVIGVGSDDRASAGRLANLDDGLQHPLIDRWVQRLSTSMKGDFQRSLDRKDQYEGMIAAKLDARGMPRDLIYLALIESEFNPTARSRMSAVGLWQFMGPTARQFGLTVRRGTDERTDPARATDAALTYLSQLHARFGSWYLAAAAYNSGQGTVARAMQKTMGRTVGTDADFFRILPSLPKETQEYVPKLLASARIGNDPTRYGMN
jgi:hypothetical protein